MNFLLVKNHHLLFLCVIKRPFMHLAVRRLIRRKRRIAGLCELDPHFAHGLCEGFVKRPSREVNDLWIVE